LSCDNGPPFLVLDDPERLSSLAAAIGIDCPISEVTSAAEVTNSLFTEAMPVMRVALAAASQPGRLDPANAFAVIESLERAVDMVRGGDAAAVVTNPIHKKTLYQTGFEHPGHTEYLAARAGPHCHPVMMLSAPALRVVPVTVHMPLRAVPEALSVDLIVRTGRILAAALRRDYGIAEPRIAVAGLNPHAGEGGALGDEDDEIVAPACQRLAAEGIAISGPLPADTMFHPAARARYDAAMCMYHDQALVPLKTLDFEHGVNVTLGLPFVRTSPDHGTALNIAGQGVANPSSLIAALREASSIAAHRAAAMAPGYD
jgi:4-hydroxythreonine-4-phosphate dehydrogenase